jgi:hypothetical protein
MSTWNSGTIGPTADGVPERGQTVYVRDTANNQAGRVGPVRKYEQLAADPAIPMGFMYGIANGYVTAPGQPNHNSPNAHTKLADGRGVMGRTNPPPSWDAVDGQTRQGFLDGTSGDEISVTAQPFMHQSRAGANANPLGPTSGFSAGSERPSTVYQSKIAPPNGGRDHRNVADV